MTEEKYYKYKMKYLNLKKQLGGEVWSGQWNGKEVFQGKYTKNDNLESLPEKNNVDFKGICIDNKRNILLIELNGDNNTIEKKYLPGQEKIKNNKDQTPYKKDLEEKTFTGHFSDWNYKKWIEAVKGFPLNHYSFTFFISSTDINDTDKKCINVGNNKLNNNYILEIQNNLSKNDCIFFDTAIHDSIKEYLKKISDYPIIECKDIDKLKLSIQHAHRFFKSKSIAKNNKELRVKT